MTAIRASSASVRCGPAPSSRRRVAAPALRAAPQLTALPLAGIAAAALLSAAPPALALPAPPAAAAVVRTTTAPQPLAQVADLPSWLTNALNISGSTAGDPPASKDTGVPSPPQPPPPANPTKASSTAPLPIQSNSELLSSVAQPNAAPGKGPIAKAAKREAKSEGETPALIQKAIDAGKGAVDAGQGAAAGAAEAVTEAVGK